MKTFMSIIFDLHRYLLQNNISKGGFKITVEFTDIETQHRCEYIARSRWDVNVAPPAPLDVFDHNFTIMGITFRVKPAPRPLRKCICPHCLGH